MRKTGQMNFGNPIILSGTKLSLRQKEIPHLILESVETVFNTPTPMGEVAGWTTLRITIPLKAGALEGDMIPMGRITMLTKQPLALEPKF